MNQSKSSYLRWARLLAAVLAIAAGAVASSSAADKDTSSAPSKAQKAPAKPVVSKTSEVSDSSISTDAELFKDLDNELLEGVGEAPAGKQRTADAASDLPAEEAGEDIGAKEQDPLTRVGKQMRAAESLIEQRRPAEGTERLQQKIIDELAQIIAQVEEQQKKATSAETKSKASAQRKQVKQPAGAGGEPGENASNKPARDSSAQSRKDHVERPDMDRMQGLMKDLWGQLPAKAREQMLQSSPDQFLPKYEIQIEKYYKRLAEEQKSGP